MPLKGIGTFSKLCFYIHVNTSDNLEFVDFIVMRIEEGGQLFFELSKRRH